MPTAAQNDGPDLSTPPPDETPAPPTVTITVDELQAMVDQAVADATAGMRQVSRPVRGQTTEVPHNPHAAPDEPTWEEPFIPTADDFARANAAADKGELIDYPVPVAGTILAVAPDGATIACTPKAFRTLYRARGYKAHPDDARRGLASERRPVRRRRGGGNELAADAEIDPIETSTAPRRRRRRTDAD